ncbi:MAG: putative two-component system response regulator [Pseudonocardiales bacterium]|nr:putative two-component system response regulator [Jatrophihabitantaceae bacterium]MCW2602248.1 putative two-component system response regulator [Pseudonocardiales bacterium]
MSGRSPTDARIRVIVVEAFPITRLGMTQLLGTAPELELAAAVGSAAECRALLAIEPAHVVTIGTVMPDADGIAFASELRDRYAGLGIVILTSSVEDGALFRALDSGASAFVSNSVPVDELLSAVRHAARSASSFTAAGLAAALRRRESAKADALSPREREVLQLLSEGHSIPSVAASLYVGVSTAKTYVSRLYDKLGADNRSQALMVAARLGLIAEPISR